MWNTFSNSSLGVFRINYSRIIVLFCFWPKLFLPRLTVLIFDHSRNQILSQRTNVCHCWGECTSGSEGNSERKFQKPVGNNCIVEISTVYCHYSEVNNIHSGVIGGFAKSQNALNHTLKISKWDSWESFLTKGGLLKCVQFFLRYKRKVQIFSLPLQNALAC